MGSSQRRESTGWRACWHRLACATPLIRLCLAPADASAALQPARKKRAPLSCVSRRANAAPRHESRVGAVRGAGSRTVTAAARVEHATIRARQPHPPPHHHLRLPPALRRARAADHHAFTKRWLPQCTVRVLPGLAGRVSLVQPLMRPAGTPAGPPPRTAPGAAPAAASSTAAGAPSASAAALNTQGTASGSPGAAHGASYPAHPHAARSPGAMGANPSEAHFRARTAGRDEGDPALHRGSARRGEFTQCSRGVQAASSMHASRNRR